MDERRKNVQWRITSNANGGACYDAAQLAVLMDIRDELQRLNELLHCANFTEIPTILRDIRRHVAPKRIRKLRRVA